MEQSPIIYSHNFGFFTLDITTSVIVQWVIIAILGIGSFLLTRNLKEKPDKKQAALEKIYITVESVVTNTMGESYLRFIPYIGSLMVYLIFLNLLRFFVEKMITITNFSLFCPLFCCYIYRRMGKYGKIF